LALLDIAAFILTCKSRADIGIKGTEYLIETRFIGADKAIGIDAPKRTLLPIGFGEEEFLRRLGSGEKQGNSNDGLPPGFIAHISVEFEDIAGEPIFCRSAGAGGDNSFEES
jgi:hypothetical protein